MRKKYFKKRFSPEQLRKMGSVNAFLMPGSTGRINDSGFFANMDIIEEDYTAELSQSEMDELFELIGEINKNEKNN